MVLVLLITDGDQVPVIPLVDVVGNGDNDAPEQIGTIGTNVGVVFWETVITIDTVVASCPASGVKV